ncbi:hypothetical protein L1887_04818 [Cichorium endivia]|nr:hypothetical protein L1887_04818 [Cichorium endivia]
MRTTKHLSSPRSRPSCHLYKSSCQSLTRKQSVPDKTMKQHHHMNINKSPGFHLTKSKKMATGHQEDFKAKWMGRRNAPISPATMVVAGIVTAAAVGYFYYANKKRESVDGNRRYPENTPPPLARHP